MKVKKVVIKITEKIGNSNKWYVHVVIDEETTDLEFEVSSTTHDMQEFANQAGKVGMDIAKYFGVDL